MGRGRGHRLPTRATGTWLVCIEEDKTGYGDLTGAREGEGSNEDMHSEGVRIYLHVGMIFLKCKKIGKWVWELLQMFFLQFCQKNPGLGVFWVLLEMLLLYCNCKYALTTFGF